MKNPNHHGPHCAGLCEGQAYNSRIKELERENQRLRGDAAEAEGVIRDLYEALEMMLEFPKAGPSTSTTRTTLALAKARWEQS